MTTAEQELQRKIEALKRSFTAGLMGRLNELDDALSALRRDVPLAGQAASIQTILEQSHKIAGSAGTFGYREMSVIASDIEHLCDETLKNQHESDNMAFQTLSDKIAALRAEMPQ